MLILDSKGVEKVVFFLNLHKHKSNKNISLVTKIVLVILLFCVLADKSGAFNIPQNFSRLNTMNIDFFANEFIMLGKVSINYSFFMALGLIGIVVSTLFALCCFIVCADKGTTINGSTKEQSYSTEKAKSLRTNNIYLINNKFIC